MPSERTAWTNTPFIALLKTCAQRKDLDHGSRLHVHILKENLLGKNPYIASSLISMYSKCGALTKAKQVLDGLAVRDVVSWSALVAGYARQGQGEEALNCFDRMQGEGFSPNAITFASVLKACGDVGALEKGKKIHKEINLLGLLEKNVVAGTALIDMYAKCGVLAIAQEVLDELPVRNLISWNALIAGYAEQLQGWEALECYERMQHEGLSPSAVTFTCILKACSTVGAADKGKLIHNEITRQGLLGKDVALGNALVDMYSKCGNIAKAQELVNRLPISNEVTWSALISGYVQQKDGKDALSCFEQMQRKGLSPTAVTFISVLQACGSIGAVDKGKEIHDEIVNRGLLGSNLVLWSALLDMYAKCGALGRAQEVLDELPVRNVISWSSLIAGYAHEGECEKALKSAECMQREGLSPNAATFTCLLNACICSGLLNEGRTCLVDMSKVYGIMPSVEHYVCMVDLLGHKGHFDKVIAMLKRMPLLDDPRICSAMLSACGKWGNVKLGKQVFEHAVQWNRHAATIYVCMANIYLAVGMHVDAGKIEAIRLANATWSM